MILVMIICKLYQLFKNIIDVLFTRDAEVNIKDLKLINYSSGLFLFIEFGTALITFFGPGTLAS